MRNLFTLCALLLLTACGSMAKQLNGSITPPAGYSYVIFSLTGQAFDPDSASISINWRSLDQKKHGSLWSSLATNTIFGGKNYGMASGKLQLLTLTPGNYEFINAYASWMEESILWRFRQLQTYPLNLLFSVKANQVIYLGEVNLDMSNIPSAQIIDAHLRDFAHIRRIWKIKDLSPISIQLLSKP